MNPDPTLAISCEYLVEFTDDGQQPGPAEPEVIILPPTPAGPAVTPTPDSAPPA